MFGYIYKTTDLRNGLIYVGKHQAKQFEPHKYLGSGKILRNLIKKYGKENFKNELLDTANNLSELLMKEEQWITALDARNRSIGYNIAPGGEGGDLVSGYSWYNDGELNYFLPPEAIPDKELSAGRILNIDNKDTIWVNNGLEQYHIKKSQLATYLSKNFKLGMLDRGDTWRDNVRKASKLIHDSETWKQNQKLGKKRFSQEHPHWTNQTSWQPGQVAHNKGKISVTNGQINKYITVDTLDSFLNANPGWKRGNTQNHKEKTSVKQEQIVETLQLQPLSEEEKASRHILGRLYGPIATSNENTRNGRKYNKVLWEKALADEIFQEKINSKALFLELGHPTDREEIDMTKVCACIPEMPKVVDGDLYAYIDILDTDNGRLLKTLCDYGFIPGISSRGSGDIMSNDEVDPDTFYLETFDIVAIPAVKKARLAMCESYSGKTLKQALSESYSKASKESRKVMKEALDNLDIKFEDANITEDLPLSEIPIAEHEENFMLVEDKEDNAEKEVEETKIEADSTKDADETEKTAEAYTIGDLTKELNEYDKDLVVEFEPIMINNVEYPVEMLGFDDSEEGKVVISVGYTASDDINNESEVTDTPEDIEEPASDEEISENADVATEEAVDDGTDEVMESVKELVRKNGLLEAEVKALKSEKTVSDAKVNELNEALNKYKVAFTRTSELAADSKKFETEVTKLTEALKNKENRIKELESKRVDTVALTESVNSNANKVKILAEKLSKSEDEATKLNEQLTAQKTAFTKQLNEQATTAKKYKNKFVEVLNKYIESKASMLGVRTTEITSKLDEQFTLEDIDTVCDDLLTESVGWSGFPGGFNSKSKVRIKENIKPAKQDDDFEDLLEFAGLK